MEKDDITDNNYKIKYNKNFLTFSLEFYVISVKELIELPKPFVPLELNDKIKLITRGSFIKIPIFLFSIVFIL